MISPRDPTAIDRSEDDRLSLCERKGKERKDQRALASAILPQSASTHVVLSDEGEELSKGSGEVGSKDGSERSNEVGGVRDEGRLVLGRVRVGLLDVSVVDVGVLLAEGLALEDLGGVESNFLELCRREIKTIRLERDARAIRDNRTHGPQRRRVRICSSARKARWRT